MAPVVTDFIISTNQFVAIQLIFGTATNTNSNSGEWPKVNYIKASDYNVLGAFQNIFSKVAIASYTPPAVCTITLSKSSGALAAGHHYI